MMALDEAREQREFEDAAAKLRDADLRTVVMVSMWLVKHSRYLAGKRFRFDHPLAVSTRTAHAAVSELLQRVAPEEFYAELRLSEADHAE
jgi:hypothetical protein